MPRFLFLSVLLHLFLLWPGDFLAPGSAAEPLRVTLVQSPEQRQASAASPARREGSPPAAVREPEPDPSRMGETEPALPPAGEASDAHEAEEVNESAAQVAASAQAREAYRQRLRALIEELKQYPMGARLLGQEGTVTLEVAINRQGEVVSVELVEGSGSPHLDRAARTALESLHRAPPFPPGWPAQLAFNVPLAYRLR